MCPCLWTIHRIAHDRSPWQLSVSSARHCHCSRQGLLGAWCRPPFAPHCAVVSALAPHFPLHGLGPFWCGLAWLCTLLSGIQPGLCHCPYHPLCPVEVVPDGGTWEWGSRERPGGGWVGRGRSPLLLMQTPFPAETIELAAQATPEPNISCRISSGLKIFC